MSGIIDAHAHLASTPGASARDLVKVMDRWGVAKASVSHISALRLHDWESEGRAGNAVIAEAMQEFPSRILGAYAPNPFLGKAEQVRDDILGQIERYGFRSIKLHPIWGGYPANAHELDPIFSAAQEAGIPILYHSGHIPYCTPAEIFEMAKRFPKVNIIVGHAGKTELCHDVLALARYAPNLYIETSGQPNRAFLERFIREIGSERVLFGSDWEGCGKGVFPLRILEVEELAISRAERQNILFGNAARLFRLEEV